MKTALTVVALLTAGAIGCSSVKSTLVNRTDNDVFIGNSNGKPKAKCAARPFCGVPITLRVPTHVDVIIKEKLLLRSDGDRHLARVRTNKRNLFVETQVIETDKVFTVDVKRPAAGTLKYEMDFDGDKHSQYFKQIKSEIEDKTIADITTALGAITQAVTGKSTTADQDEPVTSTATLIIPEVRTVAWRRFDIDAFDFEQQVALFVEQHMNNCNSCQSYQAYAEPAATVPQNEWDLSGTATSPVEEISAGPGSQ